MTDRFLLLVEEVKGELVIDEKKAKKLSIADLEAVFAACDRRTGIYEHIAEESYDEEELQDCAVHYKHFQKLMLWAEQEMEYRLNDIAFFDEGDIA